MPQAGGCPKLRAPRGPHNVATCMRSAQKCMQGAGVCALGYHGACEWCVGQPGAATYLKPSNVTSPFPSAVRSSLQRPTHHLVTHITTHPECLRLSRIGLCCSAPAAHETTKSCSIHSSKAKSGFHIHTLLLYAYTYLMTAGLFCNMFRAMWSRADVLAARSRRGTTGSGSSAAQRVRGQACAIADIDRPVLGSAWCSLGEVCPPHKQVLVIECLTQQ
jgi:hypothetical protein